MIHPDVIQLQCEKKKKLYVFDMNQAWVQTKGNNDPEFNQMKQKVKQCSVK